MQFSKKHAILGFSTSALICLDFWNGSTIRIFEISGPKCLATYILNLLILSFLLFLFLKGKWRNEALKYLLVISIPTLVGLGIEKYVDQLQNTKTKNSIVTICKALNSYNENENRFPKNLEQLMPKYLKEIPKSGFGILDSNIDYNFYEHQLSYKVKFGCKCHFYDCTWESSFSTWALCPVNARSVKDFTNFEEKN